MNEIENKKSEYREQVSSMGKKEFTLQKMKEYGFWPKDVPTPYERQVDETKEAYQKRNELELEYKKLVNQISNLYKEVSTIEQKLGELRKQYNKTWDYEKIRKEIARMLMEESIERRAKRKAEREEQQRQKTEAWQKKKKENIVYIGKEYSSHLSQKETDQERLIQLHLPVLTEEKQLAEFLNLSYQQLRFLTYHRDVTKTDQYYRYEIPKKSGGLRKIAAPKPGLKAAQRIILDQILNQLPVANEAHGFRKAHSVVTNAKAHKGNPTLLINMDLENFFPTITFARVRGMFESFGYSGHISSLLAMICTYCERMEIEVNGEIRYVKTSGRILPQGSPASPMITNIICSHMDARIQGLAQKYQLQYTRYADDMSFSLQEEAELQIGSFCYYLSKIIEEEGFSINHKKTRFLKGNTCQSITGVVINGEEVGVSKKWVKNLRAMIHQASIKQEQGTLSKETVYQISGRIAWLQSVNPSRYQKIIEQGYHILHKNEIH